ncbi:MAG: Holliday junction resolvase-like protein [Candidatus Bathyarchaeales archaeon]
MSELLNIFQSFRKILCLCPCCGEMLRLSDLHLRYTGKAPKTWLDKYEQKLMVLQRKEELFEEKERELRDKAIERGRKKVPRLIERCLCSEFRKMKYDPYDIKAIMHPVDFIVFDGLNQRDEIKSITFLSRKPVNQEQVKIIESMKNTISKNSYEWKVARITLDGKVTFE